jgi:hypothetical protein
VAASGVSTAAAASEAAGTVRAVFAEDFLLKLEGLGFPGPSLFPNYGLGSCPANPGPATSDLLLDRILTICRGEDYPTMTRAGPGNDINAGSEGASVEPCWLGLRVGEPSRFSRQSRLHSFRRAAQPAARARWRRCFAFSLAFLLLARIALLDLAGFIPGLRFQIGPFLPGIVRPGKAH